MTQTKSHLRLRALCEGAIFIALAQVLSYLKLYELPQGCRSSCTARAGDLAPACSRALPTAFCRRC